MSTNCCWLLSTGGAEVTLFPEFSGQVDLVDEIAQKFMYKIYTIRNNNDSIWLHITQ